MRSSLCLAGLALVAACTACSSSSSSPAAAAFVGTWMWVSGTTTLSCPGAAPSVTQLTGSIVLAQGTAGNTVVQSGNCTETYTVSGDVATAMNQNCVETNAQGTVTLTLVADDLTLSNTTLTENGNGSATEGASTCTFTSSGTLNKIAQ